MAPAALLGRSDQERKRPKPIKPIARQASISHLDGHMVRSSLARVWGRGRILAWLSYRVGQADHRQDDLEVHRMIGWSYQAGYGGMVLLSLYPVAVRQRQAAVEWLGVRGGVRGELRHQQALQAAREGAQMAAQMKCNTLVMATGPLASSDDKWAQDWFAAVHDAGFRPRHWLSIGLDRDGWPRAAVVPGRRAFPDRAELQPWVWPLERVPQPVTWRSRPREGVGAVAAA